MDFALQCKQRDEEKAILFNFSGHGLLDLKPYDDKMTGSLEDFEPDLSTIREAFESVPMVAWRPRRASGSHFLPIRPGYLDPVDEDPWA